MPRGHRFSWLCAPAGPEECSGQTARPTRGHRCGARTVFIQSPRATIHATHPVIADRLARRLLANRAVGESPQTSSPRHEAGRSTPPALAPPKPGRPNNEGGARFEGPNERMSPTGRSISRGSLGASAAASGRYACAGPSRSGRRPRSGASPDLRGGHAIEQRRLKHATARSTRAWISVARSCAPAPAPDAGLRGYIERTSQCRPPAGMHQRNAVGCDRTHGHARSVRLLLIPRGFHFAHSRSRPITLRVDPSVLPEAAARARRTQATTGRGNSQDASPLGITKRSLTQHERIAHPSAHELLR